MSNVLQRLRISTRPPKARYYYTRWRNKERRYRRNEVQARVIFSSLPLTSTISFFWKKSLGHSCHRQPYLLICTKLLLYYSPLRILSSHILICTQEVTNDVLGKGRHPGDLHHMPKSLGQDPTRRYPCGEWNVVMITTRRALCRVGNASKIVKD